MSDTVDRRPGGEGEEPAATPARRGEPRAASSPARLAMLVGFFVAVGLLFGINVIIVVVAIVISIFLHELGHYVAARRSGMKATEFFIGFGPKLWSFQRGDTEYGVKAIWLGAYVKIIGMNNLEEVPAADEPRTYRQQSYPKRVGVAFAGPAMNFALALVLMFVLFGAIGVPRDAFPAVEVVPGTAADAAGMRDGDRILRVGDQPVGNFEDLVGAVNDGAGQTVPVVVERDGEEVALRATLGERTLEDGSSIGFLGVSPDRVIQREAPAAALGSSFGAFGEVTYHSVTGLIRFFSPSGLQSFAQEVTSTSSDGADRPAAAPSEPPAEPQGGAAPSGESAEPSERIISILGVIQIGRQLGVAEIVGLMAALNVFLALFNLIPLLPFDGGHIAVATYERLRSRKGARYRADYAKLIPVTYVVVAVILSVGIGALYLDAVSPLELPQ